MSVQPFLIGSGWIEVRDGDESAETMFRRHYSRKPGERKKRGLIVGPGYKLLLLSADAKALFVWRKEKHRRDKQEGINCAVFRNEGRHQSSGMIAAAQVIADARWPGERHFTFVCPRSITGLSERGPHASNCFEFAHWKFCGWTGSLLMIFESLPAWRAPVAAHLTDAAKLDATRVMNTTTTPD